MRLAWGIAAVVLLMGCPGTFEGTVGGRSLKVEQATYSLESQALRGLLVQLGRSSASQKHTERLEVSLVFTHLPLDGSLPETGEFIIGGDDSQDSATATFWSSDDACEFTDTAAVAGTISLAKLSWSQAVGSFALRFGDDQVHGTFDASPEPRDVKSPAACE